MQSVWVELKLGLSKLYIGSGIRHTWIQMTAVPLIS